MAKWTPFLTEAKYEVNRRHLATGAMIAMRCQDTITMWAAIGKSVHAAMVN